MARGKRVMLVAPFIVNIVYYASHSLTSYVLQLSLCQESKSHFLGEYVRSLDLVVGQGIGVEGRRHTAIVDHEELHLGDFALQTLNELKDEVDELLLLEPREVVVPNQETEVVARVRRLLSQNFELVSAKGHESFQKLGEEHLDLCRLLNA